MKEWNEEKLNREFEGLLEEMPKQNDLEKRIEKNIRRKIQKIVIRTLAFIFGVFLLLFLIINPSMNAVYLNPYKLNQEPERKMYHVLRSYWETMQPYTEIISLEVEKKGFARYELAMQVANHTEPLIISKPNVWMDMEFGTYKNQKDTEGRLVHYLGRFTTMTDDDRQNELFAELKELPESSVISLSIGEKEPRKLEELRKEQVELEWIQVYQPNLLKEASVSAFQGGLNMKMHTISGTTSDDKPRDEMTEEELKEVYIANLKALSENTDIWEDLGVTYENATYYQGEEIIRNCYEDAKQLETLECRNYCISGKRDEIIEYLERTEAHSILVDNVKLSRLQ